MEEQSLKRKLTSKILEFTNKMPKLTNIVAELASKAPNL